MPTTTSAMHPFQYRAYSRGFADDINCLCKHWWIIFSRCREHRPPFWCVFYHGIVHVVCGWIRCVINLTRFLGYREEHSASVVLIGVLNDIYRDTVNISTANQPLLRNWPRKAIKFRKITQNYGHYAVQGHSRSPILVPIESPYTTSY